MKVGTKEFYDILESFEKNFNHMRLDKESKEYWSTGQVYENGEANNAYRAYVLGYSLGRAVYIN
jgi:hypothetical protein